MAVERLYTIPQTAEKLGGISTRTVKKLLGRELERTRVGGRVMVSESSLERYISAGTEKLQAVGGAE